MRELVGRVKVIVSVGQAIDCEVDTRLAEGQDVLRSRQGFADHAGNKQSQS